MKGAADLKAHLGAPAFAWIGRSAGALGVMAARRNFGAAARAFVCLATPFDPYAPLDKVRAVSAGSEAIEGLKLLLAQEFALSWNDLGSGDAWTPDASAHLMVVYDETDSTTSAHGAWKVARQWRDARDMLTSGLGHNRIPGAERVMESVSDILAARRSGHATGTGIAA